jgi:hypothetical protein
MKIFLTSFGPPPYQPDEHYVRIMAQKEGWTWAKTLSEADVVFLSYYWPQSLFKLNNSLLTAFKADPKPVVVLDWLEGGFNVPNDTHRIFLGHSLFEAKIADSLTLNNALLNHVVCYFKRELHVTDYPHGNYPVHPLEFPGCNLMPIEPQALETFVKRPIVLLMCCSFTSVCRMRLFGELVRRIVGGATYAFSLPDVRHLLEQKTERIVALLCRPAGVRIPVEDVYKLQEQSRITLNLRGAGRKCMRDTEASGNSCGAFQAPEKLRWAYPWIGGLNCLSLPDKGEFIDEVESAALLDQWTQDPKLVYSIYAEGIRHRAQYYYQHYAVNHLLPLVKASL